jgi:hypothetical protein
VAGRVPEENSDEGRTRPPRAARSPRASDRPSARGGEGLERVGDLELKHDPEFQRFWWKVERIAWVAMTTLVLAALLGAFGSGPLSRGAAGDPFEQPIRLEYERFARALAPTTLRAQLRAGLARDGAVRLWVSRPYLEAVRVEEVTPEPAQVEAGQDRLVYVFRVADPARPATVSFHLKPERPGALTGHVGVGDGTPLRFEQFVYP